MHEGIPSEFFPIVQYLHKLDCFSRSGSTDGPYSPVSFLLQAAASVTNPFPFLNGICIYSTKFRNDNGIHLRSLTEGMF